MRVYAGPYALALVPSLSLKRRHHLNASQLAFVALAIESVEAERAKLRMVAGGAIGGAGKGKEKVPDPGQASHKAAAAVGVNPIFFDSQ